MLLPTLPTLGDILNRKPVKPKKIKSGPLLSSLSPEEEASALWKLGGGALSALAYIGLTLDKPGAAVRGVLGGQPKQLLNLIPFSDTLGITHPSERVWGRDLLENIGALKKNKPGLDWGDVAGFGVDVLTDPITYINPFTPLTKAGLIARAAGQAPKGIRAGMQGTLRSLDFEGKTLAQAAGSNKAAWKVVTAAKAQGIDILKELAAPASKILDQPLRTAFKAGIPFGPKVSFGGGKAAQKYGAILDATGTFLRNTRPAIEARRLFDYSVKGVKRWKIPGVAASKGQQYAEVLTKDLAAADYAAGKVIAPIALAAHEVGRASEATLAAAEFLKGHSGGVPVLITGKMRSMLSRLGASAEQVRNMTPQEAWNYISEAANRGPKVPEGILADAWRTAIETHPYKIHASDLPPHLADAAGAINETKRIFLKQIGDLYNLGLKANMLANPADAAKAFLSTHAGFNPALITAISPEMRRTLLALEFRSREIARMTPQQAAVNIVEGAKRAIEYAPRMGDEAKHAQKLFSTTNPSQIARERVLKHLGLTEHYNRLSMDPYVSGIGRMASGNRAAVQYLRRQFPYVPFEHLWEVANYLKGLPESHVTQRIPLFPHHVVGDTARQVKNTEALKIAAEHMHRVLEDFFEHPSAIVGDYSRVKDVFAKGGLHEDLIKGMAEGLLPGLYAGRLNKMAAKLGKTVPELMEGRVPREVADFVETIMKPFRSPREVSDFVAATDKINNFIKTWFTTRLSFQPRNLYSGQISNLFHGQWSWWSLKDMDALIRKGGNTTTAHGKMLKGLAARIPDYSHLDDWKATREMQEELSAAGFFTGHLARDTADLIAAAPIEKLAANIPGAVPLRIKDIFGALIPKLRKQPGDPSFLDQLKPWKIRNVGSVNDVNTAVKANRMAGKYVEGLSRGAAYIDLRSKGFSPLEAKARVLLAQGDYEALSVVEREVVRRLVPFYCVPDDCEILSRRGWLMVDQLMVGEEVLALDHETGKSHWAPCEDKAVFDYNGILLKIQNKRDCYEFTPDHRWPIVAHDKHGARVRRIERGYDLRSNHTIPRCSEYAEQSGDITPREAAIAGWIVTDGYQRRRARSSNHQEMVIYQSPGKFLDDICSLLETDYTLSKPHPDTGVICVRLVGELRRRMQEILPNKESIVPLVCRLSKKAASACFHAMLKAEGSWAGNKTRSTRPVTVLNSFAQNDGPVLDAFQIAAQMAGCVAHKSKRGAYVAYRNDHIKVQGTLGCSKYEGRVWCPQTKYGTWLMRRNGRIIWTGNTYTRRMIPAMVKNLFEHPGGVQRNIIRASNTGRREAGFVPEHLGTGTYIPLGQRKDGMQAAITQFDIPTEQLNLIDPRGVKKTGLRMLGMFNPFVKAPLEAFTGKQFFQDRELTDLEGRIGRLGTTAGLLKHPKQVPGWIEHAAANTPPLSGYLTRAGTWTDPRKSVGSKILNTLTGIKVSTTDMEKAKEIQVRNLIEAQLRGRPGVSVYENLYVSPEELALLSPQDRLLMQLSETLKRRTQQRRRQEKAK